MKTITFDDAQWQIVPKVADELMLQRAIKIDFGADETERAICINLYQTMLAAAPQHPEDALSQEPVFAFRRKGQDAFCTCDEARYTELSGKPDLFEMAIFYTTPPNAAARITLLMNKTELLQEDIDCIHMNLDDAKVPRSEGGNPYSAWGRVQKYAAAQIAKLEAQLKASGEAIVAEQRHVDKLIVERDNLSKAYGLLNAERNKLEAENKTLAGVKAIIDIYGIVSLETASEKITKLEAELAAIPDIHVQEAAIIGENMILRAERDTLRRQLDVAVRMLEEFDANTGERWMATAALKEIKEMK